MAFDAAVISCFISESKDKIINTKIEKIYQPQKDELYFQLRSKDINTKLYISANASYPRIYLTDSKYDNPSAPYMFCMLLRKLLISAKITDIYQVEYERIIVIEIEGYDELRELTKRKLIVEIMGKHSNIILTDSENKIIDSIKRIDISTSSVRQILPSLTYHYPPIQEERVKPFTENENLVNSDENIEKQIMTKFFGISKLTAREIEYLSSFGGTKNAVHSVFSKLENRDFSPCIIYKNDNTPVDFSAIKISQYNDGFKVEYNNSISYIIEKFYKEKANHLRLSQNCSHLLKLVTNNIERCEKKLGIFRKQLIDASKRDKYKEYGELITANLYLAKENSESMEVINYFDESMPKITVPLDKKISPAKNAEKYFSKYNKAKTAESQANIQIKKTEKELSYLETVLDSIQRVSDNQDIKEIKEELISEGYIHSEDNNKKKKETVSSPKKYEFDGFTIMVGKNNRQNDYLTLKLSKNNDIWLHTKNIPGSHVIISKPADKEIPDEIILKAAKLAAINSKAKGAAKIPVDYTIVKNVKKPSGAKPGMVIYDNYNTVYVSPDEEKTTV